MTKRILLSDDHPLFREALTTIVTSVLPDCHIEEAVNYQETHTKLGENDYFLLFLDLNMPDSNGLVDLALIKKQSPQVPVVVVSATEDPDTVRACLDNHASGYIIKSSHPDEIKKAITQIVNGERYLPESVNLSDNLQDTRTAKLAQVNSLTPSQLKILIEIGKGKLNKQIAYDLDIKEATVKAHITSIFRKLGIYSRTQAVLLVKELDMI